MIIDRGPWTRNWTKNLTMNWVRSLGQKLDNLNQDLSIMNDDTIRGPMCGLLLGTKGARKAIMLVTINDY